MNETQRHPHFAQAGTGVQDISPEGNQAWQEPELTFIEPQLTQCGNVKGVTGQGFFGANFSPTPG